MKMNIKLNNRRTIFVSILFTDVVNGSDSQCVLLSTIADNNLHFISSKMNSFIDNFDRNRIFTNCSVIVHLTCVRCGYAL